MTGKLKFGLYGLLRGRHAEPDALVRRARLAEQAGFESLWVGDHIALPAGEGGELPRLEVVAALGFLATENIAFHVEGPATYEQITPALRDPAPAKVQ